MALHGSLGCGSLAEFALLPMSASSHLSVALGVLGVRHFVVQALLFKQTHLRGAGSRETAAQIQDPGPLKARA